MFKLPRFKTSCLQTGVKILVIETGQQLPPSIVQPENDLEAHSEARGGRTNKRQWEPKKGEKGSHLEENMVLQ